MMKNITNPHRSHLQLERPLRPVWKDDMVLSRHGALSAPPEEFRQPGHDNNLPLQKQLCKMTQ